MYLTRENESQKDQREACLQDFAKDLVQKNRRRSAKGLVLAALGPCALAGAKKVQKTSLLSTANLMRSPCFLVHITIMIL